MCAYVSIYIYISIYIYNISGVPMDLWKNLWIHAYGSMVSDKVLNHLTDLTNQIIVNFNGLTTFMGKF